MDGESPEKSGSRRAGSAAVYCRTFFNIESGGAMQGFIEACAVLMLVFGKA